jgi:MFS family permease
VSVIAAGGFRTVVSDRGLRRLLLLQALVVTATSAIPIAAARSVYDQAGSGAWASAVVAAGLLPYLLLSGLAGVFADRIDRPAMLRTTAICQALVTAALAVGVAAGAPPVFVVLVTGALAAAGTPVYPAIVSSVSSTVGRHVLASANVGVNTVEAGAWSAGPALAGAGLVAGSPSIALVVPIVFFAAGALVAHRLPRTAVAVPANTTGDVGPDDASPSVAQRETVIEAFRTGVRTVSGSIEVCLLLSLVVVVNTVEGGASIGLLFVADELGETGSTYGLLKLALGGGGLAGLLFTFRMARMRRTFVGLTASMLVGGAAFALLGVVGNRALAAVIVAVVGFVCTITEVVALTVILHSINAHVVARVFGLTDSLIVGSNLVGAMLVPVLVELLGVTTSLLVIGAVLPALAVSAGLRSRVRTRGVRPWRAEVRTPSGLAGTVGGHPGHEQSAAAGGSHRGAFDGRW